jgi:hypothetical protein
MIVRSSLCYTKTIEQSSSLIDQVLEEEKEENEENKIKASPIGSYFHFEKFDYNTFLNFVIRGDIKGKDLLALCNVSKTFQEYSNRGFKIQNNDGTVIRIDDQYLFRVLLAKMKVRFVLFKTPKQLYIERSIGGKVWSFGRNVYGELGLGTRKIEYINTPNLIINFNNVVEISAGTDYSLCLDNQGHVWGFGVNDGGELGLGDNDKRVVPTIIEV